MDAHLASVLIVNSQAYFQSIYIYHRYWLLGCIYTYFLHDFFQSLFTFLKRQLHEVSPVCIAISIDSHCSSLSCLKFLKRRRHTKFYFFFRDVLFTLLPMSFKLNRTFRLQFQFRFRLLSHLFHKLHIVLKIICF